jgi:hypothetical protein
MLADRLQSQVDSNARGKTMVIESVRGLPSRTPSHDIQSYSLHELARDDAMITEPGNSERPLAGPF